MEHATGGPETRGIRAARRLRYLWAEARELARKPVARRGLHTLAAGALAFVLAAAGTGATPLPVVLGFLLSLPGDWPTLLAALCASGGTFLFWQGTACLEAVAGIAAACLASGLFAGTALRKQPWFVPLLSFLTAAGLGLVFLLGKSALTREELGVFLLRALMAAASAAVFDGLRRCPSRLLTACGAGFGVLGLCQILVLRVLDLGVAAAALLTCATGELPMALACGLAVDLSRITRAPVTVVLCLGYLTMTLLPKRRSVRLCPALWSLGAAYVTGSFDPIVTMGLLAGGAVALVVPVRRQTGAVEAVPPGAASRLVAAAGTLDHLAGLLSGPEPPGPEAAAILFDRAAEETCRSCPGYSKCWQAGSGETYSLLCQAAPHLLEQGRDARRTLPAEFFRHCRKAETFCAAVDRAALTLRVRMQYQARLRESRMALCNQYRQLARFLQRTAAELDRPPRAPARYQVELGISATGKFGPKTTGDRGAHFPGPYRRYYVILCDGMGTGPAAAQEGDRALRLLTGMLQAGLAPEAALETLNDLYVLRETGGFSTADLLEIHLDSGRAVLYKWGGAPSYYKHRRMVKRIGTAAPPPGVGIGSEHRAEAIRLSLQRGQMLVLVSDGLSGEEVLSRIAELADQSPKALAAALASQSQGCEEDDRMAVAVCLRPLPSSEV